MQNGHPEEDESGDDSLPEEPEEESSALEDVVTPIPREVYVVDSVAKAQTALERLQAIHAANPGTIFACDTEVRHFFILLCSRAAEHVHRYSYSMLCLVAWPPMHMLQLSSCFFCFPAEQGSTASHPLRVKEINHLLSEAFLHLAQSKLRRSAPSLYRCQT